MAIDPNLFLHDSDKAALSALKAIPGFSQLLKAFMNVGYEKQYRIMNMGSNLRISEQQMPKYYHMLLPICEKLQIKVPELYTTLDVTPNACTFGDTDPYIKITSGMLETVPDELIPTVLAHECGHIVCRHTLYTMMGNLIMMGIDLASAYVPLGLGSAITSSLQMAFYYWMRCSELSADRVAAFCDGSPDKTVQLCMHFAGYDKDFFEATPDVGAFFAQIEDYKKLVSESAWNKTLEFLWMRRQDHPQSALRAYECNEWGKSQQFEKIVRYLGTGEAKRLTGGADAPLEAPTPEESKALTGKEMEEVVSTLRKTGFTNVQTVRTTKKGLVPKDGLVVKVLAAGKAFSRLEWLPIDAEITVEYFQAETEAEECAAHPGMARMPDAANRFLGRDYMEVTKELAAAGFMNITAEAQPIRIALFTREGSVAKITVDDAANFEKGTWYYPYTPIRIVYNSSAASPMSENK